MIKDSFIDFGCNWTKDGYINGNSDTTEYTATNATPTTDGQSHTNKKPPLDSCRPATDSAPPASRIGSTAQCKGMKVYAVGIKNLPTHYRSLELSYFPIDTHIEWNILSCNSNLHLIPLPH